MKGMKNDDRLMEGTKDGNEQENKSKKETESERREINVWGMCEKDDSESDTEREEERACDGRNNLSSVCVVVPCSPLAGRPSSHLN